MTRPRIMFMAILSIVLLLAGVTVVMADHASKNIDVLTKKADGSLAASGEAYSPKQTCGGCHFNCNNGSYSIDKNTWCQNEDARAAWFAAAPAGNCNTLGKCPDYESLATSTVTHNQGYPNSSGQIVYQDWTAKSPAHGASVGKHSQHGRNEEFNNAMRQIWGVPAFASSPGMWGRY